MKRIVIMFAIAGVLAMSACHKKAPKELSKAELDCLKRATQGQGGPCRASNITVNGKTTILRLWDAKGNRVHRGVIVVQGPGFSLGASEPPGDPVDFGSICDLDVASLAAEPCHAGFSGLRNRSSS